MTTVEEYAEQVLTFFSRTFNVPLDIFVWPNVIFNFIIPLVSMVLIWYAILHKGIRIFHGSFVNFILSILFAILTTPFVIYVPANLMLTVGIVAYFLIDRNLSFKKILIAFILGIGVFYGYTILMSYLPL